MNGKGLVINTTITEYRIVCLKRAMKCLILRSTLLFFPSDTVYDIGPKHLKVSNSPKKYRNGNTICYPFWCRFV